MSCQQFPSPCLMQLKLPEVTTRAICMFPLCHGWGAARHFFAYSFPPSYVSCLLLTVFLHSCLPRVSLTPSSHLSIGLPRLLPPSSRNSSVLFGSLSSAILSSCPAHCSLLLTCLSVKFPVLPSLHITPPFFSRLPSLLVLFFVPSCFRTLTAFVGVVRSVPNIPFRTGTPVSHKCWWPHPLSFWRSAGPPSPLNSYCSPCVSSGMCSSTYISPRLPVSAHCPS